MAGYVESIGKIANDARREVLTSAEGYYYGEAEKDGEKNQIVLRVSNCNEVRCPVLGRDVKGVAYTLTYYEMDDERIAAGKETFWYCKGETPNALTLTEMEADTIKSKEDAEKMITVDSAMGFYSLFGIRIVKLSKMTDGEADLFRKQIVTWDEEIEELDEEDEDEDEYYRGYEDDYDDCGMFRPQ